jgi:hypothetical protein
LEEVGIEVLVEVESSRGAEARIGSLGVPQHVIAEIVDTACIVEEAGASSSRCRTTPIRVQKCPGRFDGSVAEFTLEISRHSVEEGVAANKRGNRL